MIDHQSFLVPWGASMDCASLDRYLEAYLEGRLRRAQWLVLRRHVQTCPACRTRVEQLRRFEVDLHRRLRTMDRVPRLWTGLELDLVGLPGGVNGTTLLLPGNSDEQLPGAVERSPVLPSATLSALPLKPARPERERRWPAIVFLCLVIAGSGGAWYAAHQSSRRPGDLLDGLDHLAPSGPAQAETTTVATPASLATPALVAEPFDPGSDAGLAVDGAGLPAWLEQRFGRHVDLPIPDGFRALGGRMVDLGPVEIPAVLMAGKDARVLLIPGPDGTLSRTADIGSFADSQGLGHRTWRQDGATFDAVAAMSSERLDALLGVADGIN